MAIKQSSVKKSGLRTPQVPRDDVWKYGRPTGPEHTRVSDNKKQDTPSDKRPGNPLYKGNKDRSGI